ncbi:hypothetical protein PM082_000593 [Marasmius tenuissimus]|nr:hypothetical protein PM082_000593 [Marasmius tenuissimus]
MRHRIYREAAKQPGLHPVVGRVASDDNTGVFFITGGSVFSHSDFRNFIGSEHDPTPRPPLPTPPTPLGIPDKGIVTPDEVDNVFQARWTTWFDPDRPYLALLPRHEILINTHPAFQCLCVQRNRFPLAKLSRGRFQLDRQTAGHWDILERWLKNMFYQLKQIANEGFPTVSKSFSLWTFPAAYGYLGFVGTRKDALQMASRARDAFFPLIAACTFFIVCCQQRKKRDNRFRWHLDLTSDIARRHGSTVEETHRSWIHALLNSFAGDEMVERVGAIFDIQDPNTIHFIRLFWDLNMPVIINWGDIDEPVTCCSANDVLYPFRPKPDIIKRLKSAQMEYQPPQPQHPKVPSSSTHVLPEKVTPTDVSTIIKNIPLMPMSGQLPGETMNDFFRRRGARQLEQAKTESQKHRQARLQREKLAENPQRPGKRGARLWEWLKERYGDGEKDFFRVRTQATRKESDDVWMSYGRDQRVYNSWDDCWDLCSDLGDGPPLDEHELDMDEDVEMGGSGVPESTIPQETPHLVEHDTSPTNVPDPNTGSKAPNLDEMERNPESTTLQDNAVEQDDCAIGIPESITGSNVLNLDEMERDPESTIPQEPPHPVKHDTSPTDVPDPNTGSNLPNLDEMELEEGELEDGEIKEAVLPCSGAPSISVTANNSLASFTPPTITRDQLAQYILATENMEAAKINFKYSLADVAYARYGFMDNISTAYPDPMLPSHTLEALGNGRWPESPFADRFIEEPLSSITSERLRSLFGRLLKRHTSPTPCLDVFLSDSSLSSVSFQPFRIVCRQIDGKFSYHLSGREAFDLLIHDPLTVLQIIRLNWGPSLLDIAIKLVQNGICFHPVIPGPPAPASATKAAPSRACRSSGEPVLGFRPKNHRLDVNDFRMYVWARNGFLRSSRGPITLSAGRILARIGREVLNGEGAIHVPDPSTVYSRGQCFFEAEGVGYWGDVLTEAEIELVCGTYYYATDREVCWADERFLSSHRSWFPLPGAFNHGSLNIGFWSKDSEKWYLFRVDECLRESQIKTRSATDWRRAMQFNHKVPQALKTIRSIAHDFLQKRFPDPALQIA